MATTGYKKQRFTQLQGEMFDCTICQNVVKGPKQCSGCGNLFCTQCIANHMKQYKTCPNRCSGTISDMSARALINIYNDLDIKCLKCPKTLKLGQIQKHQQLCGRPKCVYFQFCQSYETKNADYSPYCSERCKMLNLICNINGQPSKTYELLAKFIPKNNVMQISQYKGNSQKVDLKWSTKQCGMNIAVGADKISVFLKQQAYVFRTVVVSQPFMQGRHYWQIHADNRTENQLKIGVTTSNAFDFNTAFCDHKFGYAYYGLGQLRHSSNATGVQYGKRFKKTGVLGVYLNMDKGALSFSLNGEDLGQAYQVSELKKGPIYATVALLHCSGCIIKGQLPIPSIYKDK